MWSRARLKKYHSLPAGPLRTVLTWTKNILPLIPEQARGSGALAETNFAQIRMNTSRKFTVICGRSLPDSGRTWRRTSSQRMRQFSLRNVLHRWRNGRSAFALLFRSRAVGTAEPAVAYECRASGQSLWPDLM